MWINRLRQNTVPIKILSNPVFNQYQFDDAYFLVELDELTPSSLWLHTFSPYTLMPFSPFRTNTDWSVQLLGVNDYVPVLSHLEIDKPNEMAYCQVSSAFNQEDTLPSFYVLTSSESPILTAHVRYSFTNVVDTLSLYRLLYSPAFSKARFISDSVDAEPLLSNIAELIKAYPEHQLDIDMSYSIFNDGKASHIFNYLLEHSQVKLLLFDNTYNIVDTQTVAKYKNRFLKNLPLPNLAAELGSTFLPNHVLCRI